MTIMKDKKESIKMNKSSILTKQKRIAVKKAKMEILKKEIEQLENEIEAAKNKEFNRLSLQYFTAENPEKRNELEAEIKALMR